MTGALDIAGDVSSAGAALAGLLLVFMGSIATSFEGYQKSEQRSVLSRFQTRIWFAFAGFLFAIVATFLGIFSKWQKIESLTDIAVILLFISFLGVIAAAFVAARDVK